MDQSISLNKFISDTGYCSRREADNLITQGRVLLNDRPATLGNRYKPGDTVEVDGSLITAAKKDKLVYLALNKPAGITTTTELHIKDNIISFVNYPKRIFPIGRLDKDSEGLIFLTNDGDIINKILRAANNHEKEYVVRVDKAIDTAFLQKMSQGVPILDTVTLPCKVQMVGRQSFRITLTQGLNRQIRRMCEYLGYTVTGLQRVRIMNVKLDKLALGKWRHLTETELAAIKESIADSSKVSGEGKAGTKRGKVVAPALEEEEDVVEEKVKDKEKEKGERFWEKKKPAGNAWWSDKKGDKRQKEDNAGDRSRNKDRDGRQGAGGKNSGGRAAATGKAAKKDHTGRPGAAVAGKAGKKDPISGRPGAAGKAGKKDNAGSKSAPQKGRSAEKSRNAAPTRAGKPAGSGKATGPVKSGKNISKPNDKRGKKR
ncbi:23S rRNA pseudouridine(2604) synthase RluF [Chitinophaga silvisoli]|uniref:23S rRNA pseudouridine(2604) synthase RluF n=1 Tax=Chitinophaga silvisoli TaxID=2291814 RepID=UPI001F16C90F|nr:23S rRNA pseudouridine(2604) synthase RluF [Chitinophaga silvisoli]